MGVECLCCILLLSPCAITNFSLLIGRVFGRLLRLALVRVVAHPSAWEKEHMAARVYASMVGLCEYWGLVAVRVHTAYSPRERRGASTHETSARVAPIASRDRPAGRLREKEAHGDGCREVQRAEKSHRPVRGACHERASRQKSRAGSSAAQPRPSLPSQAVEGGAQAERRVWSVLLATTGVTRRVSSPGSACRRHTGYLRQRWYSPLVDIQAGGGPLLAEGAERTLPGATARGAQEGLRGGTCR